MNRRMLRWLSSRPIGLGLISILMVYVLTAATYARMTPTWEAPDEPAHYNYIRSIVVDGRLPVLRPGDYPYDYLEQLKAERFPPDKPIDSIRYEAWQPPLYYLAAAPIFLASRGLSLAEQVLLLRLFSVALGVVTIWLTFRLARALFPGEPVLALIAAALSATVPMHVAMTSSINNDTLSELFLVWTGLLLVLTLRERQTDGAGDRRRLLALGVVVGLGLLSKNTGAIGAVLAFIVLVGQAVAQRMNPRLALSRAARVVVPAAVLALPWYVRNAVVYRGLDILGWARHDAVVLNQPRTAEWLSRLGWGGLVRQFAQTTFHSFWAQFGWMGVLVDSRIYLALALVSAVVLVGFAFWLLRLSVNKSMLSGWQWQGLALMAAWFGLTALLYIGYNVKFVQHQGRYLFPAMPAIALAAALGWREALRPTRARFLAYLGVAALIAALAGGVAAGTGLKTLLPLLVLGTLGFAAVWRIGGRAGRWATVAAYLALVALDMVCLFEFIVPQLRV